MNFVSKVTVTALVLALSSGQFSSSYAAGSSQSASIADLRDASSWAQEWIVRANQQALMLGGTDNRFRPLASITREETAAALVRALQSEVGPTAASSFIDVKKGSWSSGAIETVTKAGWMDGDGDGKFRPQDAITREEMAALLAKVAQLPIEQKQQPLSLADIDEISDWARPYLLATVNAGLMQGDGKHFRPKQEVRREEMAAILLRTMDEVSSKQSYTIEQINNGNVTVNGKQYSVSDQLKGLFDSSNENILQHAKIKFAAAGSVITKVFFLELVTGGKPPSDGQAEFSANVVLNGNGAVIDGKLKIASDYISVRNVMVKGDLEVGRELQHDFYGKGLTVEGKTLINGGDDNTVLFDNSKLGSMSINKDGVRVEAKNKAVIGDVELTANLAAIWGDSSIVYGSVKISEKVSSAGIYGHVQKLEVAAGKYGTTISGNGAVDSLTIIGGGKLTVNTTGAIGTVTISDKDAKITLPSGVAIGNIVLPEGVKIEHVIHNYDQVKQSIAQVNNKLNSDHKITGSAGGSSGGNTGSTGGNGGSSSSGGDTGNPDQPGNQYRDVFDTKTYVNRMETSVDLQVQTQQTGTVYYIAVPVDAPWGAPTAEQIKNGLQYDGSQAAASGQFTVAGGVQAQHRVADLDKNISYRFWSMFKDEATGKESIPTYLFQIQRHYAYSHNVLPYDIKNLSEIRVQFSSPVQDSITSNTNVASIIERGKLRNYGFGFFPVTSISWNLDYPDMPILSLHFDQINLGNEKGFGVEATFVKDAIYMNEQRPDGMSTKHGIGAFRHYGGEKLVELITEQLKIETGSVDDPSKADDVLHVLNAYPYPLNTELGLIDHNAELYQKELSQALNQLQSYADVKAIVDRINAQHPAPPSDLVNTLMYLNNATSSNGMKYQLEKGASALGLDLSSYNRLDSAMKLLVSEYVWSQRSQQPRGKFSNAEQVRTIFDEACSRYNDAPLALTFLDTDTRAGFVAGEVQWTPGEEQHIEQYELFWKLNNQDIVSIATVEKAAGHQYMLTEAAIPDGLWGMGIRGIRGDQSTTEALFVRIQDTLPEKPAAPNVTQDDKRNILIGADHTMEFSIDGGANWSAYDEQEPPVFPGNVSVYIRYQEDPANQVPAGKTNIFTFVDNVYLFVGASDHSNTFSDATSAMEWSTDGGSTWTAYDEQNPPEFPGDMTVLIRECGSSILPPGDTQTFEFTSTIRMQFEGNDYLSNSSHNYEYSVNDGPYVHMPFDEQVFFKPGDNVKVREEARGIFSAGQPRVFLF